MSEAFFIVLPTGWARLDLTRADDPVPNVLQQWRDLATAMPDEVADQLAETVGRAVAEAREQAAVALVLAIDPRLGQVSMLFKPYAAIGSPLDDVLALAGSDSSATLVEVPDLVCLRTVQRQAAQPLETAESFAALGVTLTTQTRTTLRVRYLLGDPTVVEDWVEVLCAASVPDSQFGRELDQASLDLLDAVLSTFRWQ